MGISELFGKLDKMPGEMGKWGVGVVRASACACDTSASHLGEVGVHVLLITLIDGNWLKSRPDEPLGSTACLSLLNTLKAKKPILSQLITFFACFNIHHPISSCFKFKVKT